MFLLISAARVVASLACRSFAITSSLSPLAADAPPAAATAPLDSVNLSGAAAAGLRSSTLACTLPLAARLADGAAAVGAPSARRLRKSLKSLLCAVMTWRASPSFTALAWSAVGSSSTAPDLRRFRLLLINASGLARSMATSIWSSDTPVGLLRAAIWLAVLPGFTVTVLPSLGALGVLATGFSGRGAGAGRAVFAGGALGGALGEALGVAATRGAVARLAGALLTDGTAADVTAEPCAVVARKLAGSNSMV